MAASLWRKTDWREIIIGTYDFSRNQKLQLSTVTLTISQILTTNEMSSSFESATPHNKSVAIIGAGLVGCLTALSLSKRSGYSVTLFELRPDPRLESTSKSSKNLRSINLAVSDRGLNALRRVDPGLESRILEKVIPMTGRMIHKLSGEEESQKYALDGKKGINSIDRGYLNELLLEELDISEKKVEVKFGYKLEKVQEDGKISFTNTNTKQQEQFQFDLVIGADGSFSKVRSELQKFIRLDYSQQYIDCAYLELSIPALDNNGFSLDKNHLHIWPRDDFMLIALPNLDGSFTSTFFAPWGLFESKELSNDEGILKFFRYNFPDAVELIGEESLLYAFAHHPRGKLLSLKCNQYNYKDKILIIGDAAHSMVPFYGQGMNCGFEDVFVLTELLDKHRDDLSLAFEEYSQTRVHDLSAIVDLAISNYKEMSHKVNSKLFLLKTKIDFLLTKSLGDRWLPLYTMVSFRADIGYAKAVQISKRQDIILNWIQAGIVGLVGGLGLWNVLGRWARK
ncbi:hypothetical protein WICPIJ_000545 [Wickerhamomyces pijperi]|uniref:Kynurenine 3-monooxygenase n=1 Tax=Wickerhamomyces pijperi TaxID=599730 RepID=A0A9P8QG91_WICPI|nr:hypothetical protein WICPIJ_000545 [Wickerhamomyces pijperi]